MTAASKIFTCKFHGTAYIDAQNGCTKCWEVIAEQFETVADGIDKDDYYMAANCRRAMARICAAVARQDRRK